MRKQDFCLCENKDADQLICSNCTADQRLCFRYAASTTTSSYIRNVKLLAFCESCTDRFVWGLVGNPEDQFSRIVTHLIFYIDTEADLGKGQIFDFFTW